jgi:hypothetical protein
LLCPLTEGEHGEKAYQVIITIHGETDDPNTLTKKELGMVEINRKN